MKNPLHIEVYRSKRGQFGWRMKRCGRIIACSGETYKRQSTMQRILTRMLACIYHQQYTWHTLDYRNDPTLNPKDQFTSVKPDPQTT